MNLPELSVRRPTLVTCVFLIILLLGVLARGRLDVGLYPNVTYPVVNVVIPYPGAGPREIESQVAEPVENALSALSGIRTVRSTNLDGAGVITAVFGMNQDIRFAEQKVIQSVSSVRGELPQDILEPVIQTVDPLDTPVMVFSLTAQQTETQLFDLADDQVRPLLEQVEQVGLVKVKGVRRREIEVLLSEKKLRAREISASEVVGRVGAGGRDMPAGRVNEDKTATPVRVLGQYESLSDIKSTVVRFVGNESVINVGKMAEVNDGLQDEKNRVYVNGQRAITLSVFRQSGGNAVSIAKNLRETAARITTEFKRKVPGFDLSIIHDGAEPIRDSVNDATEAIELGVILTVMVVLIFLGSWRSTLITGLALPNSLFGAFLLMWAAGFTVNITTLAALSLAVGLLVDDAIVVRENIFRKLEEGSPPREAAVIGTQEVALAVIATTLTVLSVFGPMAFMTGLIGQFFRQFGFTICFAMLISLLDSLTMAPMLSAYFAGKRESEKGARNRSRIMAWWERAQSSQDRLYQKLLAHSLRFPLTVLFSAGVIFGLSFLVLSRVPKTFLPPQNAGEFQMLLESAPGTSLTEMDRLSFQLDRRFRTHSEVDKTILTVGGDNGETNQATVLVLLKTSKSRSLSTDEVKDKFREDLKGFGGLRGKAQDILDIGGGAGQPYVLNISGGNLEQLRSVSEAVARQLSKEGDLKDLDSSFRVGARETRIQIDRKRAGELGISAAEVGQEMRILIAGVTPARLRDHDRNYPIRIRLREEERDPLKFFSSFFVPNLNHRLIPLSEISRLVSTEGPATIFRENRKRFIQVSAAINPGGLGLGHAMSQTKRLFESGKIKLPAGVHYEFSGQTKDFQDLMSSVILALALSVGAMYFVLASLYESFFIPLSIMLVLPLAACGAFYALAVTGSSLDIYSIVGSILLLGVAAKNSILLVDYIHEHVRNGMPVNSAILEAGKVRLRPILMTSFALIAGMLPVAFPFEVSARQRSGMAIAVIGGLITSTLLTLVVVPAAYGYIQRFQAWLRERTNRPSAIIGK